KLQFVSSSKAGITSSELQAEVTLATIELLSAIPFGKVMSRSNTPSCALRLTPKSAHVINVCCALNSSAFKNWTVAVDICGSVPESKLSVATLNIPASKPFKKPSASQLPDAANNIPASKIRPISHRDCPRLFHNDLCKQPPF